MKPPTSILQTSVIRSVVYLHTGSSSRFVMLEHYSDITPKNHSKAFSRARRGHFLSAVTYQGNLKDMALLAPSSLLIFVFKLLVLKIFLHSSFFIC